MPSGAGSITTTLAMTLTTVETVPSTPAAAAGSTSQITHNQYNVSKSIIASGGDAPGTKCAYFQKLMSGGAGTIDLTALTGTNAGSVDLTGLKVQAILITALATNANSVTISTGASNGYALAGEAFSVALAPGQSVMLYGNDATPDVASGYKTIDLAGTLTQGVNVGIVAG